MVKALILDLDGTLVDSHEAHIKSYLDAFNKRGLKANRRDLLRQFGKIAEDIIIGVFPGLTKREIKSIVADKRKFFANYINLIKPLPCAVDLINCSKLPLVIATSNSRRETILILNKFSWRKRFSLIMTSYDVLNPKPAPDLLLAIVKSLGTSDCLFVGDSIFDALSGRAAGIDFIGVETGSFNNQDFKVQGFKSIPDLCSLTFV